MKSIRHKRTLLATIGAVASLAVLISRASAADVMRPDADGYIRHWLMLAPIALPEAESCAEALLKEQIKGEAALRPRAGDTAMINGKEFAWRNITASTNYFDFNAIVKSLNDHVAGFIVTYIECDEAMPNVIMTLGSNDQGRLYLNGTDIYAFTEARTLELDADKGRVTLNKGVNVVVFKIINEQGNWQGAMRFLDKSGRPLKDLKIKLSP
jgi:hypothetical protein